MWWSCGRRCSVPQNLQRNFQNKGPCVYLKSTSEPRRAVLPIEHCRVLPVSDFLPFSLLLALVFRRCIKCYGAVYVEKQRPPFEAMFLGWPIAPWSDLEMVQLYNEFTNHR